MSYQSKRRRSSRRLAALTAAASVLAVTAAGCSGTSAPEAEGDFDPRITVYGTLSMEAMFNGDLGDRLEELGLDVTYEALLTAQVFTKSLALRDNPEASLIFIDTSNLPQGEAAGLWSEIDSEQLPNAESLIEDARPEAFDNLAMGIYAHTLVLQYRSDLLEEAGIEPPTSLADLEDPALNGRVGLTSLTSVTGVWELVSFAWANGGDVSDIDPGFEYANQLATSGQTAEYGRSANDITQLLQQGEIWVAAQYGPGALQAANNDPNMGFSYIDERTPIQLTAAAIPTNAKNPEAAHMILNELASQQTQSEFAELIYQVPVRPDLDRPEVTPGMDEVAEGRVTLDQLEEIAQSRASDIDWGYIGAVLPEWTRRWAEEVEAF